MKCQVVNKLETRGSQRPLREVGRVPYGQQGVALSRSTLGVADVVIANWFGENGLK